MVCDHLKALEAEILAQGIAETFRGQAWTRHCREWVYFDCYLDVVALRKRLNLPECVIHHINHDSRSGQECGFVCTEHDDAIVGVYAPRNDKPTIR